jgi:hypothetical protein
MVWKLWTTYLDICHGMEAVNDILRHLSWYGSCGRHTWTSVMVRKLLIFWIFVMVWKLWTTYLDICHGMEAENDILGHLSLYESCGRHTWVSVMVWKL